MRKDRLIVISYCLAGLLLAGVTPSAYAQTETHVDGFGKFLSAKHSGNYFYTHRGAQTHVAYVQTKAGKQEVVWQSQPVPAQVADRVVFAWDTVLTGLYHRTGQFFGKKDPFLLPLFMNGKKIMDFRIALKGDTRFTVGNKQDPNHIELFFDYLTKDWAGNLNGIMYLSVPSGMVTPGKPATFRLEGRSAVRIGFCGVAATAGTWGFASTVKTNPTETKLPKELKEMAKPVLSFQAEKPDRKKQPRPIREFAIADPQKRTSVAIISGLTGNAEEKAIIESKVARAYALFSKTFGYPDKHIYVLTDKETTVVRKWADTSIRNIRRLFAHLAKEMEMDEALLLILVGHANGVGDRVMFNIRGKDLRADSLPELLKGINCRHMAVCVFTPLSGAFIKRISQPGRVIITSCQEGQIYRTGFALPFFEALASADADTDGNGLVSLLEAFHSANKSVASMFEGRNFLRTEQALLDDNGDGAGSSLPSPLGKDGKLSARFFLINKPTKATQP